MWIALAIATGAAVAILLWTPGRPRPTRLDWVVAAFAVPALFLLSYRAAESVISMLSDTWTFIRVMPGVALSRGYRLYYPEGQGPLLGWSYGPFMPAVHGLLGLLRLLPTPAAAVVVAGVLNEVVLLGPLLLLIWRSLPGPGAAVLLSALHGLMLFDAPTSFWLNGVQVDTFAIGFLVLGFWTLLGAEPAAPISRARLAVAAALIICGIFSKQNEIFAAVALIAYVWLRDGRRGALTFTLGLCAAGAVGVLLSLAAFGWDALFLNMWLVQVRCPRLMAGWSVIGTCALEFAWQGAGLLLAIAALAVAGRRRGGPAATRREWLLANPWIFLVLAALLIFPISVLARAKVGGAVNSNHGVYHLFAALAMLAAGFARGEAPVARVGVPFAALGVVAVVALAYPWDARSLDERLGDNRLAVETRFSKAHPEEVWFSANPLVTLYTDGKLYHHGYGVYDRILPNLRPTPRHLQEHLPARLRWVGTVGAPFWMPDGLTPIPPPEGVKELLWFERR